MIILNRIEGLRDELIETFKESLYYAFIQEPVENKWSFMIILQNPGKGDQLKKDCPFDEAGIKEWFMEKDKKTTFEDIFKTLIKYEGIKEKIKYRDNYKDYIENDFLDDFYVTDLIHIRCTTGTMDKIMKKQGEKWAGLLKEEIIKVSPEYIISFGSRTWEALKEIFKDDLVNKSKVTKEHGNVFPITKEIQTNIIPLAFIPGTSQYLRTSYIDYLEQGLQKHLKISP